MEVNDQIIKLYSIAEAAKLLGIGRDTLLSIISEGKMGVIRIRKRKKIAHSELMRFLNENTVRNITDHILPGEITSEHLLKNNAKKRKSRSEKLFEELLKENK